MEETFARARTFIYRNARPLDLARWQVHFENGPREAVVQALTAYQNADGGFGHALEADAWNPNSTPIQTWCATQVLREIGFDDATHPVVQGILRYLESGQDFDGRCWKNTVQSNNDYPHAPWWHAQDAGEPSYNPTASLAGWIIRFAPRSSALHALGCRIACQATDALLSQEHCDDMHLIACYITLADDLQAAGVQIIDVPALERHLRKLVSDALTQDTQAWENAYVCKPSQFMRNTKSPFYLGHAALAEYERDFIVRTQLEDGSWPVNWGWAAYPEEWALSKNWWKADIIIGNLLYLRGMAQ